MECINKYVKTFDSTIELECVIYKLLKSKEDTKTLRDKMIIEDFDRNNKENSTGASYELTARHFNCSIPNVKYIVSNRSLL